MAKIKVNSRFTIPEWELMFTSSRSSGPGGQHVNRTESRVTLAWHFMGNPSLSLAAKDRLTMLAGRRVKADGSIQISADVHRSQKMNQQECISRLRTLVLKALSPPKKRKATKLPKREKEKRLKDKKKTSEKKQLRRTKFY